MRVPTTAARSEDFTYYAIVASRRVCELLQSKAFQQLPNAKFELIDSRSARGASVVVISLQELANHRVESIKAYGFRQIAVEAGFFIFCFVSLGVVAGHRDGRDGRLFAYMMKQLDAGSVGQADVGNNQIKMALPNPNEGLRERTAALGLMAEIA